MSLPTVSVVIPAANAWRTIKDAIRSVQEQDYGNIVDLVVAAGDARTAEAARLPGVTVVDNPTGRTPAGLNLAVAAGTGDVVVRVDAHSVIPPDYVSVSISTLLDTGADNVGGMQIPVGDTFWSRAIATAMASPAGSGDARYRIGGRPGPVETVYLGTFRRTTLERLGGFDESYERHQDYELNERIRNSGGTVWFNPELKVTYRPRASLKALSRQYFDYGTWKRSFSRANPGSLRVRQMAPPALVVALPASAVGGLVWPWLLVVPAGYLAGLVATGVLAIRSVGISAAGVPVALATMHLSWGIGFLVGQTSER